MLKPNVSIIVPVYNVQAYLRTCINSLISQTLKDIEIIAVNDASTDNSLEILREYEAAYKGKVVVIDSPVNLRQGGARNLGIKAARADYIGFVDSDDWAAPNMFKLLYEKAVLKDADITQILHWKYVSDNDCEQVTGHMFNEKASLSGKELTDLDREILLLAGGGGIWSKLYRRALIVDNDIFFPQHLRYEDNFWDPLIKMYAKKYVLIPKSAYYYRQTQTSTVTLRNASYHLDRLTIERMKLEEYKKRGLFDRFKNAIEASFTRLFYFNTVSMMLKRFDKPDFKLMRSLKRELFQTFPRFLKNPYYFTVFSKKERIFMRLLFLSPRGAYQLLKLRRALAKN